MGFLLSFLAGALSTLSPCVLPALPLVVGSAAKAHRFGAFALAGGLVASSTLVGFILASIGPWLGIDAEVIRIGAAILLVLVGLVFLSSRAQATVARLLTPMAARANGTGLGQSGQGLLGQFLLGAVLGAVWSPCAGPTLGAAIGLAAKEGHRFGAFLMMLVFGIGAATPLLVVGSLLGKGLAKYRGRLASISQTLKPVMGLLLVAVGAAILSGQDTVLEGKLLALLPASWIHLVSRI